MSDSGEEKVNKYKSKLWSFVYVIRMPIIVSALIITAGKLFPIYAMVAHGIHYFVFSAFGTVVFLICAIWAGRRSYRDHRASVLSASLAGPVLLFFSFFLVELAFIIPETLGSLEELKAVLPSGVGHPMVIMIIAMVGFYLFLFPISMGVSAIGAAIEKRAVSNTAVNWDGK